MRNFVFVIAFTAAVVVARPEPPVDEPLEGPRHYPELLPRVRDLLIYDNPPGAAGASALSNSYGVPGSESGSFGGSGGGAPRMVILADPELAPLLSTFDLSPTVEKRMGQGSSRFGGSAGQFGTGGLGPVPGPFGGNLGQGGGSGYN